LVKKGKGQSKWRMNRSITGRQFHFGRKAGRRKVVVEGQCNEKAEYVEAGNQNLRPLQSVKGPGIFFRMIGNQGEHIISIRHTRLNPPSLQQKNQALWLEGRGGEKKVVTGVWDSPSRNGGGGCHGFFPLSGD